MNNVRVRDGCAVRRIVYRLHKMAAANTKWRTREYNAVLLLIFIQAVNGYEESYTVSQLSPKSEAAENVPRGALLQTSQLERVPFTIEPSRYEEYEAASDPHAVDGERDDHIIVARSADPVGRESRSINVDSIPSSNNEIDNELEIHNKRKYYDIHPTKTVDYYYSDDDVILSSEGFGDRLEFKFPGEGQRVPKARALAPSGPRIRPTAVQPILATVSPKDEARQNTEIQNIITGIVKLLNGNVNVQANSQLLNGRPGRPMASRINNRGPPRISDLPPDFDKLMITPPPHPFAPTKIPPPYPFDRPHHGVNLPDQIVPPMNRPGIRRPMPPWQRPRPRPPNRKPNPNLPAYKPVQIPQDLIGELSQEDLTTPDNDTTLQNNISQDEITLTLPDLNTTESYKEETKPDAPETTSSTSTTTTSTTTTTEASTTTSTTTTTEKPTTTEQITTTEQPTTTTEKATTERTTTTEKATTTSEVPKTEKPIKQEKDKKKEITVIEKDKKHKIDEKIGNKTSKNETAFDQIVQSSVPFVTSSSVIAPTPTEGLPSHAPAVPVSSAGIESSSINSQPIPPSRDIHYHPYRPRPGIVLDDPEFKPHGRPHRQDAPVVTAHDTRLPGYGEIFDVTVSAVQGPGEKGGSVHIETVNLSPHGEQDIIVSASGSQGFVSIDGKRTYLNLFDSSTPDAHLAPTRVHTLPMSAPPHAPHQPPHGPDTTKVEHAQHDQHSPTLGTGVAIPTDDVPPPLRRPVIHRPQGYRRPQPTVRIDTCIVGDDSTCDLAQNERCRTEAGISSCGCRAGYGRRVHRDPCRRVTALLLAVRIDRMYDTKITWDPKLTDKDSELYQQLSYEALRAIDSAFSMTPFSDEFVSGSVNSLHTDDERAVFVNYTILMQESPESVRPAVGSEIQKQLVGVLRRRNNNLGASALHVRSLAGSVPPLHDVDECSSPELNDCHQLATCTNTWGGFKCACPETTLDPAGEGRECRQCGASLCSDRGECAYRQGQPTCSCRSGYYGSRCEVDGGVVGAALGASLAAALVIALTLAALLAWSRKWSREQKAVGSPVFNYMTANTVKTPPVGQPPYQVTLEERLRWAQIAEAMAAHYAPEPQSMTTRPSSAMFGAYPTLPPALPPVPLPRMGVHGVSTVTSRANTAASHHNLYGYGGPLTVDSSGSESSGPLPDRTDLLMPRPKSRARTLQSQNNIYYDVDYENAPEPLYGTKGIPLSTYSVSRGPPFYRP